MGFACGIVGLPNVGKSTIFNALTAGSGAHAEAANYPFCTIQPNTGIVKVPDPRLKKIAEFIPPQTLIPAVMTFVDIAGLVKGASKGEGLGNQFLGHIRETNAIAHVTRCFDNPNIVHVDGSVDPARDISVIDTELIFADLEGVVKRYPTLEKQARTGDKKSAAIIGVLSRVRAALESGKPVRALNLSADEQAIINDYHLITIKPVLYVANMDEQGIQNPEANKYYQAVKKIADAEGSKIVAICGAIEAEISAIEDPAERSEFLKSLNLPEAGLDRVIRAGYELLGLQTYFTAGEKEVRAWTIHKGDKAPQAAGVIHTDFEKGFIRAEVYHFDDLVSCKSEAAVKDKGLMRLEGKEYVVKDGDIMHFRFNV
ncbi:MAG: redox-regulated ATPase YchF [Deltaproteobacteria bacterium]|nr:redox-regulated ATPase YchF [Deltaproteobacteria bacterium]